jgi:hypothetical protein
VQLSGWKALAVRLGLLVLKMLGRTWRFELDDRAGVSRMEGPQKPLVWVVWHNRLLPLPTLWARQFTHRDGAVLVSRSRDGAILARCIELMGGIAVRGSSSRGGASAAAELARLIEQKVDVYITPDGPRGPRYTFHPGALWLSRATGAPIVPVSVEISRYWRLASWDGFFIPKPFARIAVTFHPPPEPVPGGDESVLEVEREKLRQFMLAHTALS